MRRETHEFIWRVKLIIGLAGLGFVAGWLGWTWWLAEESGGSEGWGLREWFIWSREMFAHGLGREILIAAGAGAAALAGPVLIFLLKPRGSGRPF